jgi:AmmeMemoRadiSam system protein B
LTLFIRPPAVAGRFYPKDPATLSRMIESLVDTHSERATAIGVVVPHAGYIYSGHVAGAIYSRIRTPSRTIILCPNHTGFGRPLSIMQSGLWQTPLGTLQIDSELCDALMAADPELENDIEAHRFEHAIEVQLPFLQALQAVDGMRFVPIAVGVSEWKDLERLGRAIGETIRQIDPPVLIIASSDMNHYESDAVTRAKDALAIDPLLKLDARGLHETVRRKAISMCGVGPAAAMIVAAKILGATRAELVKYATSAEVSRDFSRVVGYAGVVLT